VDGYGRVHCKRCGVEHDIFEMEPSYRRPDPLLDVPEDERDFRVMDGKDLSALRSLDDSERRYFLRVLLPFRVHGESEPCSWGVWVEISEGSYDLVNRLWDDTDQHLSPPFRGTLINALKGYDDTVGLPGSVQLMGPHRIPAYRLDDNLAHPLAKEFRDGVGPERVLEWFWIHH
jgi:hypothetical protein